MRKIVLQGGAWMIPLICVLAAIVVIIGVISVLVLSMRKRDQRLQELCTCNNGNAWKYIIQLGESMDICIYIFNRKSCLTDYDDRFSDQADSSNSMTLKTYPSMGPVSGTAMMSTIARHNAGTMTSCKSLSGCTKQCNGSTLGQAFYYPANYSTTARGRAQLYPNPNANIDDDHQHTYEDPCKLKVISQGHRIMWPSILLRGNVAVLFSCSTINLAPIIQHGR